MSRWRDLAPPAWLLLLVLAYTVTYSVLSIRKHDTFHSSTFDLAIFAQVLWNTAHGRVYEVSLDRMVDTELIGSYLGNHVRPIFLLIAPLYRLWPNLRLLFILQSFWLGLGALPLWWIARRELRHPELRIAVIVSYLLYPALGFLNLFDFHPVALSIPLLFLAYWALQEERNLVFWAAIVLSLATKEELVVPIAAFGIYCLFRSRTRTRGVALLLLAALWAYLCFLVIIPHFNEGRPYRFFALWSDLMSVLPATGNGGGELPSSVDLSRVSAGAIYVFHLFFPLGFLPLLNPGLLAVALPSLAYLLLANDPALYTIGFQYSAVLIPWLFISAVQGLAWIERRMAQGAGIRIKMLALGLLLAGIIVGGIILAPIRIYSHTGYLSPVAYQAEVEAAMAQIPPWAGVATGSRFGPHLAHRRYLLAAHRYPAPIRQDHLQHIDYVLLDLVDCHSVPGPDPRAAYTERVHAILDTDEYAVQYWSGRILLLKRGAPVQSEIEQVGAYVDRLRAEDRPCEP